MTNALNLSTIIDDIRALVDPSDSEQAELTATATELRARAQNALDELPVSAELVQAGSTARGTFVTGDRDIDMFVAFPPAISSEELEEYGLEVGHSVLPDGREEYASHPYVKGTYNDFEVDLVPCYNLDSTDNIQSAVDRTPFHTRYLEPKINDDLASDVRVAKYFLKQVDIYGSNDETEGFSGYLTELLVVEAGGFEEFLHMVADWHGSVLVDPAEHVDNPTELQNQMPGTFRVVDPVDPSRNVADVVSKRQRARLQHHARAFLDTPSLHYFETNIEERHPYDIIQQFNDRDTAAVAVVFDRPDQMNETLVPQLKRSLDGMVTLLERHSFDTLRSTWFTNEDSAVLFAEVTPQERAAVEEHRGPPIHIREACEDFLDEHPPDSDSVYINDNGRYVLETPIEHRTPTSLLNAELVDDAQHGKHVLSALESDFNVVRVDIATTTANEVVESFQSEFNAFQHPRP